MRVKICGITNAEQGSAIAYLGATALGFMCVRESPRYVTPAQIQAIVASLPTEVNKIGVFANANLQAIVEVVREAGLTGVQLHGDESPGYCQQLLDLLPNRIELLKAFRIKTPSSLAEVNSYISCVDTLLLDAYHPQMLGGTGATIDWTALTEFQPDLPWFLAGGLTPDNILAALLNLKPDGIDLSSGVERSPGDKDLDKVNRLFSKLKSAER
ncbi:MAG: phosphoribosylanthranilate isomerase [Xenococcaceae cyanobacterium]